jgi:hypothetical protein
MKLSFSCWLQAEEASSYVQMWRDRYYYDSIRLTDSHTAPREARDAKRSRSHIYIQNNLRAQDQPGDKWGQSTSGKTKAQIEENIIATGTLGQT